MNTTLRFDGASETEAVSQAPTITSAIITAEQSTTEAITSAIIEAEQSTTEAISSWAQSWARLAPVILQGFVGALAVLYLLGACALAAVLLFYTFSR
jgi:hypothetical protein